MRMKITTIYVNDQEKALHFYNDVLGFVKKKDIPMGAARWLTVASPEGPEGVELLLEPNEFPPAKVYQKSLFDAGIPATAFAIDDIQSEYDRLTALGVVFRSAPTKAGPATVAAFDDTCGNVIQLYQVG